MHARRILQTGAFNPEDLNRLQGAFDTAWRTIAPTIVAADHANSRELLATVVVSAGNVSGLDAEELATVALRTFKAIRTGTQTLL
jgi:hypothetical protein